MVVVIVAQPVLLSHYRQYIFHTCSAVRIWVILRVHLASIYACAEGRSANRTLAIMAAKRRVHAFACNSKLLIVSVWVIVAGTYTGPLSLVF